MDSKRSEKTSQSQYLSTLHSSSHSPFLPLHSKVLHANAASTGGVLTSFAAWKNLHKQDQKLPGLENFTNEQLFFVKWAQNWCTSTTATEAVRSITNDTHSPGFARIRGPFDNSRDFKEAFNCPRKEPTCELW